MPHSIKLKSGELVTLFDIDDLLEEIEKHMGSEARCYVEDWKKSVEEEREADAFDSEETKKEMEQMQDHNRALLVDLKLEVEAMDEMLNADRMNRKNLREVVRCIGRMIDQEL